MRCKHVRVLLVDRQADSVSGSQSRLLNDHLEACGDCREFQRELKLLRQGIRIIPDPVLADDCERNTRELCYREIISVPSGIGIKGKDRNTVRIPRLVYLALMVLVTLTLVLIFPVAGELPFKTELSLPDALVLTLVLQNAVMLLLSPLLIRRYGGLPGQIRQGAKNG
jgi:hypothetical protein